MDIWYQYMSGASMCYHEQGFDEYWMPGGTSAAGIKDVQLSPKGKLVDRFLRITQDKTKDRGTPFTPVAFLLDYAHGWEPSPFSPHAFGGHADRPDLTLYGEHEQMLHQYFWTAYYPIGPKSTEPITATNEVYVPGIFGDIFDVTFAYPDLKRWTTISTYPVVIAAGDIELTVDEGKRLAQYVNDGGTLLVADGQLSGPGVTALDVPQLGNVEEANEYVWTLTNEKVQSQKFRFRHITGGNALAQTPDGKTLCASFDRGQGRLIFLSVPRALGIDRNAVPVLAQLFAHLTRGVMPAQVEGGVEWMLNKNDKGWVVTLLNPAGQAKPQHGITPTDFRENRRVLIRASVPITQAADWLFPDDSLRVSSTKTGGSIELTVPAGGVRIIELK
jgi:hypothetical protein